MVILWCLVFELRDEIHHMIFPFLLSVPNWEPVRRKNKISMDSNCTAKW